MTAAPGLERFVAAQARHYDQALAELQSGAKTSHWMWFIFPQLAALGRSSTAIYYGLADRAEAEAYLAHPLLRSRLETAAKALLPWAGKRPIAQIMGPIDAVKLASSMTLFEQAGGSAVFGQVLDAFHGGQRDRRTLALLAG